MTTVTLNTASTDLGAFQARYAETVGRTARLREQRHALQAQLAEAMAAEMVDGKSTSRRQAELRRAMITIDDELRPLLEAAEQGQALFQQAERVAARRQLDAATAQRAGNPQKFRELLDGLDAAFGRVRDLNQQLSRLVEADSDAYDAQRRAISLGRLAGESAASPLPPAGWQEADVVTWFAELRRARQQLAGGR